MLSLQLWLIYWRPPPADRGPSRPNQAPPTRQHALTHRLAFFLKFKEIITKPNQTKCNQTKPNQTKPSRPHQAQPTRQHALTHRLAYFLR